MPIARPRHRIAIVGANFAGLAAAQRLSRVHAVSVVDASPWFEWLPNVHELLSGVKTPATLRLPRRRLVRAAGHRFVCARVAGVDAETGRLRLKTGAELRFDACILAVGGVNETYGVPGAERHAHPFKSVADCNAIGRRLAALLRSAQPVSVVIVGGGLEGVEALGEILRCWRERPGLAIHLVEAAPRLLPDTPRALCAYVRELSAPFDVTFHLGRRVTRVGPRRVTLDSGTALRTDLTIWTGGASAPALLAAAGLAERPGQWAPVAPTLQSRRFANVFVAGDAAALARPLGKQAYYALQMGEHVARNVDRWLRGERLEPFTPAGKPRLIAFGDLDTVLVAGKTVVASPALAAVKEAVFQVTMAQIDHPGSVAALGALADRVAQAALKLLLPTLTSSAALLRLPRVRVLAG